MFYNIMKEERKGHVFDIFYSPSEFGNNYNESSEWGKFYIVVDKKTDVGDVVFYEGFTTLGEEYGEYDKDIKYVGFKFKYQDQTILLSFRKDVLEYQVYPKLRKLDELEVFKIFKDNLELEYIERETEHLKEKYILHEPTRQTILFLNYCGINWDSYRAFNVKKITKEEAIEQKGKKDLLGMYSYIHKRYFVSLNKYGEITSYCDTKEKAEEKSSNVKEIIIHFFTPNVYNKFLDKKNNNDRLQKLDEVIEKYHGFIVE